MLLYCQQQHLWKERKPIFNITIIGSGFCFGHFAIVKNDLVSKLNVDPCKRHHDEKDEVTIANDLVVVKVLLDAVS